MLSEKRKKNKRQIERKTKSNVKNIYNIAFVNSER